MPTVLAINKIDLLGDKSRLMEQIAAYSEMHGFEAVVPVSHFSLRQVDVSHFP